MWSLHTFSLTLLNPPTLSLPHLLMQLPHLFPLGAVDLGVVDGNLGVESAFGLNVLGLEDENFCMADNLGVEVDELGVQDNDLAVTEDNLGIDADEFPVEGDDLAVNFLNVDDDLCTDEAETEDDVDAEEQEHSVFLLFLGVVIFRNLLVPFLVFFLQPQIRLKVPPSSGLECLDQDMRALLPRLEKAGGMRSKAEGMRFEDEGPWSNMGWGFMWLLRW